MWLLISAIDVVFHCYICHGKNKAVEDKFDSLLHKDLEEFVQSLVALIFTLISFLEVIS